MSAFLEDGYSTLVTFDLDNAVALLEVSVTPPGYEGGDSIDVTTMRNTLYKTFAAQGLITVSESSLVVAYDPVVYGNIQSNLINKNGIITFTFSDGSSIDIWGYLKNFTPNECAIGERPTANCTVTPTNRNNSQQEVAPVYTPA